MTRGKTAILYLTMIAIIIASIVLYFNVVKKNYFGFYGGISDDGTYFYLKLRSDGIAETNLVGRNATAQFTIDDHIFERVIHPTEEYAIIELDNWTGGYYGLITGAFYDDYDRKTHIRFIKVKMKYGIESEEQCYYELGEDALERGGYPGYSDAMKYFEKAGSYKDAAEKYKEARKLYNIDRSGMGGG